MEKQQEWFNRLTLNRRKNLIQKHFNTMLWSGLDKLNIIAPLALAALYDRYKNKF